VCSPRLQEVEGVHDGFRIGWYNHIIVNPPSTPWLMLRGALIIVVVLGLIVYAMLGGYYVTWMLETGKLWPS
jgi:hypothetical protein